MTDVVRLRPHSYLLTRGLAATSAFSIPVLLVLYYLTIPSGSWLSVLVVQLVATVLAGFAIFRYLTAGIWVDQSGIAERGFFRNKRFFPAANIGSVLIANAFRASEPDGIPQLFVCDHDGRQLVRMRGEFWSRATMQIVATTLEVPVIPVPEKMTARELTEHFPGIGYWFERRPIAALVVFSAASFAVVSVSLAILRFAGATLGR